MSAHEQHATGVEESDPDTATTILVTLIGTLILVIVVLVLQGLYERVQRAELRRKLIDEVPRELQMLRVGQMEKLSSTAWVDAASGVVSIPVERAMEILVQDPAIRSVPPPAPVVPPAASGAPAPQGTAAR